ncbi:MAG: glutamate-5-semialdehyde dehydrogenase [Eubacteriales bacterium]|nr:glutamate-5-semialdehyde dehydrogenase [Eubacteriales bacterium]MDD3349642.1 glutamate-5-semialdehyde dehydrogenase [Eubacteriales bacterium]
MTEADMMRSLAARAKKDSPRLASQSIEIRNTALAKVAELLADRRSLIFEANEKDLLSAEKTGLPLPVIKRLHFDEHKLADVLDGIKSLIGLPDPLFRTLLKRELDSDLLLEQITCPIGVIGVIFESRPDALVQIATLCMKSGNCAILKGGSEAANTNKLLFDLIYEAGLSAGLPAGFLTLAETRSDIDALLQCDKDIDLLIPRGSNSFVRYIMDHSKIPVLGHADGICHIYCDASCDIEKAIPIILDSKAQYVAACNAVETLLVHEAVAAKLLPALSCAAAASGIKLLGDSTASSYIACEPAQDVDWRTEYLDLILSIKIVGDLNEAVDHINRFGSHHTDSIVTEDVNAADLFMLLVDSAGVYHNCSTRFADGFRYGFGAEVGISTGKIHARGPVGLDGLVTYKYKLHGTGQIVGSYANGERSFHFKDL